MSAHQTAGEAVLARLGAAAATAAAAGLMGLLLWTAAGRAEPLALPAAADPGDILLLIDETDTGLYQVVGRFWVPATLDHAWAVLTDYDHIDDFTSSMASSRILRTDSGRTVVEQRAVVGMFVFKRSMEVILEVTEYPKRQIDFRDVGGRDMDRYQGSWLLEPWEGGVRVTYTMEALPRKSAPHFLERYMVNRNSSGLLREVRDEILRRAGGAPPG